jgi:hypothetical protein
MFKDELNRGDISSRFLGVFSDAIRNNRLRFTELFGQSVFPVQAPKKAIQEAGFPKSILAVDNSNVFMLLEGKDDFLMPDILTEIVEDNFLENHGVPVLINSRRLW